MPQTDESSFRITVELPTNANLTRTDKVARQLEDYLKTVPEVTYYTSMIGGKSLNQANIQVTLKDRRDRSRTIWEVTNDVRRFAADHIYDGDVGSKKPRLPYPGRQAASAAAPATCAWNCAARTARPCWPSHGLSNR